MESTVSSKSELRGGDSSEKSKDSDPGSSNLQQLDAWKMEMVSRLGNIPGVLQRFQHKEDPDWDLARTTEYMVQILQKNIDKFIRLFGEYLTPDECQKFLVSPARTFETTQLIAGLNRTVSQRKTQHRNRRLQHMRKLLAEGVYFSREEMAERAPLLYEEYVGQYMTDEEASTRSEQISSQSWSAQLMSVISNQHIRSRREHDRAAQQGDRAASSENAMDETEDDVSICRQQQQNEFVPEEDTDSESEVEARDTDKAALQAGEKGRLFGEFERLMRERFLNGDDSDFFDYSTVDNNVLLDDDAITDQDAEDVYFDDD
eukprot:m.183723 g.183723  ORF g.183723 m.183723 type:complete len:317 (+) comp18485_c0_seq2:124-1074(+)